MASSDQGSFETLPAGYEVQEYRVERVLGQGGFGITYLARDTNLDSLVAIKEYLPTTWAGRDGATAVVRVRDDTKTNFDWGLRRFLDEARTIARFHHPNIVQVLRYFKENNTAYMVMRNEDGTDLGQHLKGLGRVPAESEVLAILLPLLDGLRVVHAMQFLHRDIKPSNIIIRRDGSPVLLDFGSAREAAGERATNLTRLITRRYSPPEQATGHGAQGPWTDLFALAGVAYRMVTGEAPVDSSQRAMAPQMGQADPLRPATAAATASYSPGLLRAIDWALTINPSQRPQSVDEWQASLGGQDPDAVLDARSEGDDDVTVQLDEPTRALQRSEADDWLAAVDDGSVEAYDRYLENHPDGLHAGDARSELTRLQDELTRRDSEKADWRNAREKDQIAWYQAYLASHPEGAHVGDAQAAIRRLQDDKRRRAAEAAAWEKVEAAGHSLAALNGFLKDFPAGPHAAAARAERDRIAEGERRRRADDDAWKTAERDGSVDAYERYLDTFPDGEYAQDAKDTINELHRQAQSETTMPVDPDWDAAKAAGTLTAFQTYLERNPAGFFAGEAVAAVNRLRALDARRRAAEADWKTVSAENTLHAYARFVSLHADSPRARDAEAAIERIKDEEQRARESAAEKDWQHIQGRRSPKLFEDFIVKHPHTRHSLEAQRKIEELKRRQLELMSIQLPGPVTLMALGGMGILTMVMAFLVAKSVFALGGLEVAAIGVAAPAVVSFWYLNASKEIPLPSVLAVSAMVGGGCFLLFIVLMLL